MRPSGCGGPGGAAPGPARRRWPGTRGTVTPRIRRYLAGRGIRAVIPRRSDQRPADRRVRFDRAAYRRRNAVERWVNRLKEYRRVGTRYEELAVSYLAAVQVACIREWLKRLTRPLSDRP